MKPVILLFTYCLNLLIPANITMALSKHYKYVLYYYYYYYYYYSYGKNLGNQVFISMKSELMEGF